MTRSSGKPPFRVRRSKIHGTGVFATQGIRKGARISEYVGERVSHAEADRRYEHKADDDNHTFLFTVDARTVIDGGMGGNEARFINHSCDPNCEAVVENRRVYIEAIRAIPVGEEISYDYGIERSPEDPPNIDEIFACRCGAVRCRGSMILPPKKPRRTTGRKGAAGKKSKVGSSSKSKGAGTAKTKSEAKPKTKAKTKAKTEAKAKAKGKAKTKTKTKTRR
jgi:hypothetical protein